MFLIAFSEVKCVVKCNFGHTSFSWWLEVALVLSVNPCHPLDVCILKTVLVVKVNMLMRLNEIITNFGPHVF